MMVIILREAEGDPCDYPWSHGYRSETRLSDGVPIQHVVCQPQDIAFPKARTIQSKIKPIMMKPPIKTAGGKK